MRAVAHIQWAVLVELPSLLFKHESMLAWDQAVVAAAMGSSGEVKMAGNDTVHIHNEMVGEQQCSSVGASIASM